MMWWWVMLWFDNNDDGVMMMMMAVVVESDLVNFTLFIVFFKLLQLEISATILKSLKLFKYWTF